MTDEEMLADTLTPEQLQALRELEELPGEPGGIPRDDILAGYGGLQ
jgi:hypothetical protein